MVILGNHTSGYSPVAFSVVRTIIFFLRTPVETPHTQPTTATTKAIDFYESGNESSSSSFSPSSHLIEDDIVDKPKFTLWNEN